MAIWNFTENDAHGVSIGKTLPAYSEEQKNNIFQRSLHSRKCSKNPMQTGAGKHIKLFLKDKVKITEKQS